MDVADSTRTTINKEPSYNLKRRILLCENSPIRLLFIKCKLHELKSWVSVL